LVQAFNFPSKFQVNAKREMTMFNFRKENGGIEKLMQIVNNAFAKMPEQKFFLDKIMNELKATKDQF